MQQKLTLYDLLGGESGVAALTRNFYRLMDTNPRYAALRAVHGESLDYANERLFEFLSGWSGGPPLYMQKHGHPRLRDRHMPFVVTVKTRNQWIACFAQALQDFSLPRPTAQKLLLHLFAMGDWMRNRDEPAYPPPQPPMAYDPQERRLELAAILTEYAIDGYFDAICKAQTAV